MLTLCAMLIEALLNGWILDNPFDRVRKGELIMRGNQETAEQRCYSKLVFQFSQSALHFGVRHGAF
jgi:hypothetical protein